MFTFKCHPTNRGCDGRIPIPPIEFDPNYSAKCPVCGKEHSVSNLGLCDGIKANKKIKGSFRPKFLIWP